MDNPFATKDVNAGFSEIFGKTEEKKEDIKAEYDKLLSPFKSKSKEVINEPQEEPAKIEKPVESRKSQILKEHNMIESDIPVNSHYWKMRQ